MSRGASPLPVALLLCACAGLGADLHDSEPWGDLSRSILEETNRLRSLYGLAPVRGDASLEATARNHSRNMAENAFWAHVDPQGRTPLQRVCETNAAFQGQVAENLWKCARCDRIPPEELPARVVAAWLHSPGHRENLLNGRITHIGVGVSIEGDTVMVTQLLAVKPAQRESTKPPAEP